MLTEIRIYYEGDAQLKPGFAEFFRELSEKARARKCRLRLISSKGTACGDFGKAIETHTEAWNILLMDSEKPYAPNFSVALCKREHWDKSHADSIFWMVEMMESWFHADKDALEFFYGVGFRRKALKANPQVEQIAKKDLKTGLQSATKDTARGNYFDHKTSHGPKILACIDPLRVRKAAPNCRALFEAVLAKL